MRLRQLGRRRPSIMYSWAKINPYKFLLEQMKEKENAVNEIGQKDKLRRTLTTIIKPDGSGVGKPRGRPPKRRKSAEATANQLKNVTVQGRRGRGRGQPKEKQHFNEEMFEEIQMINGASTSIDEEKEPTGTMATGIYQLSQNDQITQEEYHIADEPQMVNDNEEVTATQEKKEVIEEDNAEAEAEETDLGQDQDEMPQLSMEINDEQDGEEEENFLRQRAPTQEPTATEDQEEEEMEENFLLQRAPTQEPTVTGSQEGEEEEESASQQMQMAQSTAQEPRMNRDGYLLCDRGETITDKFKMVKKLGEGVFAKVIQVRNLEDQSMQALKIIRKTKAYRQAAVHEIKILLELAKANIDVGGREKLIVEMRDYFDYFGHSCIVFDLYGASIFDFMKANQYHPYPMDQICYIAYQLIHALHVLHSQRLTHTDLKPENIIFVNSTDVTLVKRWHKMDPIYTAKRKRKGAKRPPMKIKVLNDASIRLIDMGSAVFDHHVHEPVVSTRHYRAPEVILELSWSQPCDIWSMGCIIFELYTGHPLIPQVEDREHLAMIERAIGKIPHRMRKQTKKDFFANGGFGEIALNFAQKFCKPLKEYIREPHNQEHILLFELIAGMLTIEPDFRMTLDDARIHPYFNYLDQTLRNKVDNGGSDYTEMEMQQNGNYQNGDEEEENGLEEQSEEGQDEEMAMPGTSMATAY